MARFHPLYVRRSDGKLDIVARAKRKETNEPTAEQLDQKPDRQGISDYYRQVSLDEMKSLDWRRKLGGMLAREMGWKDKSGQGMYVVGPKLEIHGADMMLDSGYMLAAFPENYRLYEHVKKTVTDGKTEVKSKRHAGGGNDRQDAYLYGHPEGRKKRFRSPADFFPHLLWLANDESGDPDNCGCKLDSPEELEASFPGANVKPQRSSKPAADIKSSVSHAGAGVVRQPSVQAGRVKPEPSTPAPRPAATPKPLVPVPTPLPQPKTADQQIDSQYRTFMYRPGELIWFRRGQAWGLGVVLRRWVTGAEQYHYTVQPLSWPHQHPQSVTKSSDLEMRPWLAWSVPRFTNDVLNNQIDPARYETADWQGMTQHKYGNGDMEVDGSILAAKAIDATYTLFDLNKTVEPEPGLTEKYYDGLFLGAEKVWAGDPLRLQIGSGTDIMVLHSVVERKRTSSMSQNIIQQTCHLVGDIYTLSTVTHADPSVPTPAAPNKNPHLPTRLTRDLAFRNARSIPVKRTATYWKLVATQRRLDLNEIKGRWYEASILLPILQQQQFEEAALKGEIQEASLWMNSRGDCQNSNRPANAAKVAKGNVRKETRREAFGRAVPDGAVIVDGVVVPGVEGNVDPALGAVGSGAGAGESMDIDPRFDTADGGGVERGQQQAVEQGGGGFEEFMNLDDDGPQLPGFGQEYGSQAGQGGYY
ncbi:hypothetical protein LTR08_002291 [Meristemomyces frigidus]|nr:hypothetical protein LTR08_002291 [Meristemomyces frigidus]